MAKNKKYKKIVIGIDQSYKCTGITVVADNKIKNITCEKFEGCKNNSEKRSKLRNRITEAISIFINRCEELQIICERIRLHSQGFISQDYIKSTGALISVIIDSANVFGLPVYSVDTRAWKKQVIGTSKPKENKYGIDPNKYPTIEYIRHIGRLKDIVEPYQGRGTKGVLEVKIQGQSTRCKINDDKADSVGIALYGFIPESKQSLKQEHF